MKSTAKKKPYVKIARSRSAVSLPDQPVAAAKAKAEFLALIERVNTERRPVTITKRGKPLVQIIPVDDRAVSDPFGCMKGSVKVVGDIVGPEPDVWEAMA